MQYMLQMQAQIINAAESNRRLIYYEANLLRAAFNWVNLNKARSSSTSVSLILLCYLYLLYYIYALWEN